MWLPSENAMSMRAVRNVVSEAAAASSKECIRFSLPYSACSAVTRASQTERSGATSVPNRSTCSAYSADDVAVNRTCSWFIPRST